MKACRLARTQTWAGVGLVACRACWAWQYAVDFPCMPLRRLRAGSGALAAMPCMPCFGLTEKHARLQPASKPCLKHALGSQLLAVPCLPHWPAFSLRTAPSCSSVALLPTCQVDQFRQPARHVRRERIQRQLAPNCCSGGRCHNWPRATAAAGAAGRHRQPLPGAAVWHHTAGALLD